MQESLLELNVQLIRQHSQNGKARFAVIAESAKP